MRQTIRAGIEFAIAELLVTKNQRRRLRACPHLPLNQAMNRFGIGIRATLSTPCLKLLSFRLTQQLDLAQRLLRPFGQRGQHAHIVRRHALDRRRGK